MGAAITRAEKLAEENEDLKNELKRLRETAHSVRAQSPDDALATQTLAVLERLEAATHVDAAPIQKKEERADLSQIGLPEKPKTYPSGANVVVLPPPARRRGIGAGTLIIACFVCLAIGIMLGAMTR